MTTVDNDIKQKISYKFNCKTCDYGTSRKHNMDIHLLSAKHQKLANDNGKLANDNGKLANDNGKLANDNDKLANESKYCCKKCDKIYNDRAGLWRHNKKCIYVNNEIDESEDDTKGCKPGLNNIEPQMLLEVLKQNQDFQMFMMDQQKQMMDLASKVFNTNNTINNTNCNNTNNINNSFNLQVFLNEKCKDAMNMSEFIDTIKMQLSDLENFAHLGYADGVSNIFVQGINALDVHLRPIHCSDSKRETLYIKDNNEWIKETDDKPLIKSAIKRVAFKNIKQINEWIKENPECKDPRTKKYDKYNKIVMNSMSGGTIEEQQDNIEKIVKNVTKAVTIDKYALK
jgi:hypothetical protein